MNKKIIGFVCIVAASGFVFGAFTLLSSKPQPHTPSLVKREPVYHSSTTNAVSQELSTMKAPKWLIIPSLGIDNQIVPADRLASGVMAMPDSLSEVGWYMHGPMPGNPGNAVLAAHTGFPHLPSIFRKLDQLRVGDSIQIKDTSDAVATFEIIDQARYRPEEAPLTRIFGDSPTSRLNLITCIGEWNEQQQSYSHRLVLFAVRSR